jgi:hypothetical protein
MGSVSNGTYLRKSTSKNPLSLRERVRVRGRSSYCTLILSFSRREKGLRRFGGAVDLGFVLVK